MGKMGKSRLQTATRGRPYRPKTRGSTSSCSSLMAPVSLIELSSVATSEGTEALPL
ncbi:hypothetical protein M407DRAFT_242850 [Tulasnella calospora MUT 4182]|uniref:Uncharacterized protein n=1 Tax=Tulasnella calospora MUT 4182 TaxID=1051891 RepID=A0A0C3QM01_9AGAM|nr:hypothetical protein M407DRAFT_242850 [Tulasnella calospora MUT 4182]